MKSQNAVSIRFPLCDFPQNKEHLSEKRLQKYLYSVWQKIGRHWWTGTKQRSKKNATCLTSCIVLQWYTNTNITLPHCLSVPPSPHTYTRSSTCKQKLEMAFSRSRNTVHDTIPGPNWLCFCKDIYLLNHSMMFLTAALTLTALPSRASDDGPPETRQCYCRVLDTVRQREAN